MSHSVSKKILYVGGFHLPDTSQNPKEEYTMTVKSKSEKLGQGVGFERIRRITGYLVGTMDKWNDAKRAEERDRVKHGLNGNA